MKLIKYLIHQALWERLPMPPRSYSVEFDPASVDKNTETLMAQSHVRCPQGVKILQQKHRATPRHLIDTLPSRRRRRRPVAQRALSLMRHILGQLPYDPMAKHARRGRSRHR